MVLYQCLLIKAKNVILKILGLFCLVWQKIKNSMSKRQMHRRQYLCQINIWSALQMTYGSNLIVWRKGVNALGQVRIKELKVWNRKAQYGLQERAIFWSNISMFTKWEKKKWRWFFDQYLRLFECCLFIYLK